MCKRETKNKEDTYSHHRLRASAFFWKIYHLCFSYYTRMIVKTNEDCAKKTLEVEPA